MDRNGRGSWRAAHRATQNLQAATRIWEKLPKLAGGMQRRPYKAVNQPGPLGQRRMRFGSHQRASFL